MRDCARAAFIRGVRLEDDDGVGEGAVCEEEGKEKADAAAACDDDGEGGSRGWGGGRGGRGSCVAAAGCGGRR